MRIVVDGIVYNNNNKGGIARYFTEVLSSIKRFDSKIRLDVVIPSGSHNPDSLKCRVSGRLATSVAVARGDIFHTSYYTQWPRIKYPIVVTVYDFIDARFPLLKPNGIGFVERQFDTIKKASAVIAISQSTKDLTIKYTSIDPSKIFLAYPGISLPFSGAHTDSKNVNEFRSSITNGAPYLIHVGRRGNYKNFKTTLRAFCIAAQCSNMDRHLVLIGGEYSLTGDEIDIVISSNMLDRIHLIKNVDDETLKIAYAGADAMVHSSLMEGFGIPVIEAIACGTGLILSDIPVYREIADGYAVFVKPNDIEGWIYAMQQTTPIVHGDLRTTILSKFDWNKAAQVHLNAYSSVV